MKKLHVQDFRNYEEVTLETNAPVNIFVGNNAQGKTNLLEAIYMLALTRSHRAGKDAEMIRWHQQVASIFAQIEKQYGSYDMGLTIAKQGKTAKINGLIQSRLTEYIGHLNVVLFAPEDLELVKGSPGVRRRFLDIEIGQIQSSYLYHLSQYKRALAQKNKYLQSMQNKMVKHDDLLTLWNEQMAQHAVKIIKKRLFYLEKLSEWAQKIHAGITNGEESLKIRYHASLVLEDETDETVLIDDYMLKLEMLQEKEIRRGNALVGPHRDDLLFFINDKEVHVYGSQGQQRTTALSLKLAEIELIHEVVGEYPLLLLDDVLSELDEIRQTHLINTFQNKVQTFITTTSTANIDMKKVKNASVFDVSQGTISRGS